MESKVIYTVGHSSLPLTAFCRLITDFGITCIVDVRRFPSSKRHPQFNKSHVRNVLQQHGIIYQWLEALGGFRREGYVNYMNSEQFTQALLQLESYAESTKTAIMCAELSPLHCHRYHVPDALVGRGWRIHHLGGYTGLIEHHEQMVMGQGEGIADRRTSIDA